MEKSILCIKLGGSVITDKKTPYTAKKEIIMSIARSLKKIKQPLLIAHGSGSFAHTSAKKYGGKNGYTDKWGIAKVNFDVMQINNIVMEIFIEEKLPVVSFAPRSMFLTKKGEVEEYFFDPFMQVIEQGLIPVVYGDVIWDSEQKTTIFSGEKTLNLICRYLKKKGFGLPKIIQLSDVDGVLDHNQNVIPEITRKNWIDVKKMITKSTVVDVTGGMTHKIEEALTLTKYGIETWIVNGNSKLQLKQVFLEDKPRGTVIR